MELVNENAKSLSKLSLRQEYFQAATSPNTRRAYQADIRHFASHAKMPSQVDDVLRYLEKFGNEFSISTLRRRLVAVQCWHQSLNLPSPCSDLRVSKMLRGIQRSHPRPIQSSRALSLSDLLQMLTYLKSQNDLAALRTAALIQIGFFAALRRSELVNVQFEHLHWQEQGLNLFIPQSKTDPLSVGAYVQIAYGNEHCCPLRDVKAWLEAAEIDSGPIFRRINKHGQVLKEAIKGLRANLIVQTLALEAKLPKSELISAHSLRSGFASAANLNQESLANIMQQGRWKSSQTAMRYIQQQGNHKNSTTARLLESIIKT